MKLAALGTRMSYQSIPSLYMSVTLSHPITDKSRYHVY